MFRVIQMGASISSLYIRAHYLQMHDRGRFNVEEEINGPHAGGAGSRQDICVTMLSNFMGARC